MRYKLGKAFSDRLSPLPSTRSGLIFILRDLASLLAYLALQVFVHCLYVSFPSFPPYGRLSPLSTPSRYAKEELNKYLLDKQILLLGKVGPLELKQN